MAYSLYTYDRAQSRVVTERIPVMSNFRFFVSTRWIFLGSRRRANRTTTPLRPFCATVARRVGKYSRAILRGLLQNKSPPTPFQLIAAFLCARDAADYRELVLCPGD